MDAQLSAIHSVVHACETERELSHRAALNHMQWKIIRTFGERAYWRYVAFLKTDAARGWCD